MKPTTDGAQLAIEVADALCARPSPDDAARLDELLVGWSHLSVGRSAIARALSHGGGVWDGMRDQVTRSLLPDGAYLRPSSRNGIWAGPLIARADEASGSSPRIREQDIVAGLIAYVPGGLLSHGIDEAKFVSVVRELEGAAEPTPAIGPEERRLDEIDDLATTVVDRIERGDDLSATLPPARRLAERANRPVEAAWLHLEAIGIEGDTRKAAERSVDERAAARIFARLHATADLSRVDVDDVAGSIAGDPLDRSMVAYQSIPTLERAEPSKLNDAGPIYDAAVANAAVRTTLFANEARRILNLVRQEVHRFVSQLQTDIRRDRRALELFGRDALVVLGARLDLLEQLRIGVDALDRPDGKTAAAQAARLAVMALGRDLYHGPKEEHQSPRTHKTYRITTEMHALAALLDGLWERMPERRPLLETAYRAADEAYTIGSRKDPQTITDALARQALQDAFLVARALLECGVLIEATGALP